MGWFFSSWSCVGFTCLPDLLFSRWISTFRVYKCKNQICCWLPFPTILFHCSISPGLASCYMSCIWLHKKAGHRSEDAGRMCWEKSEPTKNSRISHWIPGWFIRFISLWPQMEVDKIGPNLVILTNQDPKFQFGHPSARVPEGPSLKTISKHLTRRWQLFFR